MGFTCGLVGLPNAGKSTLFNALTGGAARVESYPFCTIEANTGTARVPDPRLDQLASRYPDRQKVYTQIQITDVAGLVEHASAGEGMGNQFLSELRPVDAILHVVRCFDDEEVSHMAGHLDPVRDIAVVETELLLKDYETMHRVLKRLQQETKGKDRAAPARLAAWEDLLDQLSEGLPLRTLDVPSLVMPLMDELSPLTAKPYLYVANAGDDGSTQHVDAVFRHAASQGALAMSVRGRLEAEIRETAETLEERTSFLQQYGLSSTALDQLVLTGYRLLSLVTFYTTDGPEVRAWTVPQGTLAPQAGARIHSDFFDRFVLAEILSLDQLMEADSERSLREAGLIRRAGRDYVIMDGDIVHFICA